MVWDWKLSAANRSFKTLRLRQTCRHFAFSKAFSWTGMRELRSRFHWSLFQRFEFSIGSNNGLAPTSEKPLFEQMMGSLPAHICVTRPQWINISNPRQNVHNYADDITKLIVLYDDCLYLLIFHWSLFPASESTISPNWHLNGGRPFSEAMVACLW